MRYKEKGIVSIIFLIILSSLSMLLCYVATATKENNKSYNLLEEKYKAKLALNNAAVLIVSKAIDKYPKGIQAKDAYNIALEDRISFELIPETGKLDLNNASLEHLTRVINSLESFNKIAKYAVRNLDSFRKSGKNFNTITDINSVLGLSNSELISFLTLLTVWSDNYPFDIRQSSTELRSALGFDNSAAPYAATNRFTLKLSQLGGSGKIYCLLLVVRLDEGEGKPTIRILSKVFG